MFAAFALGAPVGAALYDLYGFRAIAGATAVAPLVTLFLVAPLKPVVPPAEVRPSFLRVLGLVWQPGLGAALSSVAFGAITAFVTLLFSTRGWSHAWMPYSIFAAAFILARFAFGHLPDRMGGARVALVCLLIEAVGQALIWWATEPTLALVGAALTGLGYSLVYPGFGVEAVLRAPPQSHGLAMGAYTAFLDLALGVGGPTLGLVASWTELRAVFLISALAILCAVPIALRLLLVPIKTAGDEHEGSCHIDRSARSDGFIVSRSAGRVR